MLFRRPQRIGAWIREGDDAQRRGDWATAFDRYTRIVAVRPDNADIWVQLGHAAKAMGKLDRSEQAYRAAIGLDSARSDTHLQLGHVLKMAGQRQAAIDCYADAARADPDNPAPLTELIALGARDAVPDAVFGAARQERALIGVAMAIESLRNALSRQVVLSTYPVRSYDAFRRAYPVPPPPASATDDVPPKFLVLIDARRAAPSYLRASLISLLDQSNADWRAIVWASPAIAAHPVASFANTDPRIRFVSAAAEITPRDFMWCLSLLAGVVLDPQAMAWFGHAMTLTKADAAYGDHDSLLDHPRDGRQRANPVLNAAFDPDALIQSAMLPPALLFPPNRFEEAMAYLREAPANEMHRSLLLAIGMVGRVAHIPRVLASIPELPQTARGAPFDAAVEVPLAAVTATAPTMRDPIDIHGSAAVLRERDDGSLVAATVARIGDEPIRIVIPTRDQPEMLRAAVDTLYTKAALPDRLRLTIVDNRSSAPETMALLDAYRTRGIDVLTLDEPFNWSRANNLAAAATTEPNLLFVNNDTEMLTKAWDNLLVGYLQRRDVGAVGARLLYPDRTVQHAGVLFMGGSPRHEGVGAAADDPGPLGRWRATRAVGAVTGAFLAIRRETFAAVDGFDERRLAIAFNDIDLCLKVRARGRVILYAAAIELTHHESKTRGYNDVRSKVAWDLGEFQTLADRWGTQLDVDPGYNPQWADQASPFDGLREPSARQVIEHIHRSAARDIWRVEAPADR